MNFKDIIGQPKVKTLLQQLAGSDRIPHALLFLGNTGQGNLALALTFAQLLQCESSDRDANDPEPCRYARPVEKPLFIVIQTSTILFRA
ncbi:MAG: hypothetical protein R2778_05070 [Saprospiraceae bacterium]